MGEFILYDPDVSKVITKVLKIGGRRWHAEENRTSGEQCDRDTTLLALQVKKRV